MGNCYPGKSYKRLGGGIIIEANQKYSQQHESIQKLTAMTLRLENTYNYYHEQFIIHKLRAIAYEQEGHDTSKALYYLKLAQNYEMSKHSISNLQILLANIQIKLRLAVETSETMDIIKDESETLRQELAKIYNETKIMQTLNNLEQQMDKVKSMQELIQQTKENITKEDRTELKQWCDNRYQILKDLPSATQGFPVTENYYATIYTQEQQRTQSSEYYSVGKLLSYIPSSFDSFFSPASAPALPTKPQSADVLVNVTL